jgi:UDPglucose 6-dehydrogenase
MKITVVGTGYVGLSMACLLSRANEVVALDIDKTRVDAINSRMSPISDSDIESFLKLDTIQIRATLDLEEAYKNSKFIIVAVPTDFKNDIGAFDTSIIEKIITDISKMNKGATVVIKSTVPIGFTAELNKRINGNRIIFSPEFLREGSALHDNLYPSRIVIGGVKSRALEFGALLLDAAERKETPILYTESSEAEAIKLFSNAYLALRVGFFNELDSFSIVKGLSARQIISGLGYDPRIGELYNNPSFGFGGYCLPKDTRQLAGQFSDVPSSLIKAIFDSNRKRIDFIAKDLLAKQPKVVGFYRLTMKWNSDNCRESSTLAVLRTVLNLGANVIVYEPYISGADLLPAQLVTDIRMFKERSSIIVANRFHLELEDVANKIYSRDVFNNN